MKHCLKQDYSVEIKDQSEVKAIFAAADAAKVSVYDNVRNANDWDDYPNLTFDAFKIDQTRATPKSEPDLTWLTVAEFIGCILGIEPERLNKPSQPVKLQKGDYCIVDSDKYDEIISIAQSVGFPLYESERRGKFDEGLNTFVVSPQSGRLISISSDDTRLKHKLSFDEFCERLRVSGTEPEATISNLETVRFKVTKLICEENGEVVEFIRNPESK